MYHNITRRHSQNKTFLPIFIITAAKKAHLFVCRRTGFLNRVLSAFVKRLLLELRVIDCDSIQVVLCKT